MTTLPQTPLLKLPKLPFPHIGSGKVREIYDLGDQLLIIATDRLSAFDVILPNGIPGKGVILTQISLWWFEQSESIIQNHLVPNHHAVLAERLAQWPELIPYAMLVSKLKPLPLEAVVRAYLAGGGWKAYQDTSELWGHALPTGLQNYDKLPQTLFTPSTKAASGHDESITEQQAAKLVGQARFKEIKDASLKLFALGQKRAEQAKLILADTKFEFGVDSEGKLYLIDEILTPDSSRYWPADTYAPGTPQQGFDKQFVRDYLEALDWDKTTPGPVLPDAIIQKTLALYKQAWERIVGSV